MTDLVSDCTNLLAQLVALDTTNPGGNELPMATYLKEHLAPLAPDELLLHQVTGTNGRRTAAVYARWGEPRTVVNVHLDTVGVTNGWQADPFCLRVQGSRLIGLGTADTKGAIAAALVALAQAKPRPQNCGVLFSGDEEQANACMPSFLALPQARDIGCVVVCEPTGNQLGYCHRGIMVAKIDATSPGGHSCFADQRTSPLGELARVSVALLDWGAHYSGDVSGNFPGLCLNLANITGGTDYNIIPSAARLLLSLRPPPGTQIPTLAQDLRDQAGRASSQVTVDVPFTLPPFLTTHLEEFRPHFGPLCDHAQALGFWTEAAMWAEAGINAVVCGPGQMTAAHAAEEWVDTQELLTACAAFMRFFGSPTTGQ